MFAAVAAKRLPDVHDRAPLGVVGFGPGIATTLTIQQLSRHVAPSDVGGGFGGPTSLIITVSMNMVVDGLLIGVAFPSAPKTGVISTIALAVETPFVGAAAVAILPRERPVYKRLTVPLLFDTLLRGGVTSETPFFGGLSGAPIAVVLAFGAANLISLVTEELRVKAQEVPATPQV